MGNTITKVSNVNKENKGSKADETIDNKIQHSYILIFKQ